MRETRNDGCEICVSRRHIKTNFSDFSDQTFGFWDLKFPRQNRHLNNTRRRNVFGVLFVWRFGEIVFLTIVNVFTRIPQNPKHLVEAQTLAAFNYCQREQKWSPSYTVASSFGPIRTLVVVFIRYSHYSLFLSFRLPKQYQVRVLVITYHDIVHSDLNSPAGTKVRRLVPRGTYFPATHFESRNC